ncbi:cellulose biosynthesis protein BcsC [Acidovorax sp. Leaf78]|uniref:cellulose biosynthesis protein BcsC n=1 Tax=Acidovorax sp. Leaf78 TaxID=1736237 RepID=UPI000A401FCF|nr:cellulose biosynthesis protein BcsC [Acidovorax sp. Leaf78]
MSSKNRRHHTLALGLMASLMAPAAWAQTGAEQTLLDQGQYWQERGDTERAGEAWQKLLRINPQNAQALYGMALVELNAQRPEGAQRYLTQLQAAHPRSPLVSRLQDSIRSGRSAPQIETARQQARSGQASQALSTYQAALGDRAPTGPLALEYYQTLGATAGGWDEARRGLSRLAQESPEDPQIALALAQHLTYRDATRREGIGQLARLAGRPDVGKTATESWRKALAWTGTRSADIALYQDFLRANPGDTAVQTRLTQAQNLQKQAQTTARPGAGADPLRQRTTAGFQALDDGELDAAEAAFSSVLEARPADGDALGGLGILRLRQERFADARGLLERASRAGSASRWKQALDSATYWSLVEQATSERERGDTAAAQKSLEQAVRLNPAEVTAQTDLADLLVEAGQYDAAEAAYRRVLTRQADNPDAVRGLVGVLAQNNKAAEALALVEKLSPSQQEKVGALGRLRAAQALGQARAATERGDTAAARAALEDALLNDPASPWVRLDLARLYLRMGAVAEARGVMDGLLISNPNMPEALYASALLASEASDWPGALALLDRIPEKHRTRDIAALQKRVWVHVQSSAASALAAEGRQSEALATLAQAESFATQDTELLGALALAYADAGEPQRALGMVRQVLARTPRPDVGLRLQYAATLLKTQQDVELAGILRQLQTAPMNDRERKSFADIRRAYIVRQADGLREAGDLAAAYDTLAPLLAEQPEEPLAMAALARMYAANNDYAQAQALYARLLEKSPNDVPLILQTAAMATGAKDYGYAESLLSVALARAPRDPEVLTAAGRLYRAQGKNSKATEFFTAAVAAENAQRDAVLAASGVSAGPARSGNPFAQRAGLQRASSGLSVPVAAGSGSVARSPVGYTPMQYAPQPVARSNVPAGLYIPDPAGASRFAPPAQMMVQAPPMTPASYYPDVASAAPAAERTTASPPASARRNTTAANARTATAPAQRQAPASSLSAAAAPGGATAPAYLPSYAPAAVPAQPGAGAGYIPPAQGYAGYPGMQPTAQQQQRAPAATQPSAWATAGGLNAVPDPTRPRTARDELREVQQSQISSFSVGATARARQGEAGMSQLSEIEAPVQLKMSVGDGHVVLGVTPTGASAGSPGSPYGTISRFGGGPVTALDMPERAAGSQSDSGIGLSVGYETSALKVDIGTTPLGFGQADVTGGVRYRMPINDDLTMAVDLSRRPVTDSLLSFAGARDARTGDRWGGVSATGGRLDVTWDDGELGVYGYGSLHGVTGTRVRSNARVEAGGGMYWHVHRTSNADLTAGLSFSGLSYQRNLRYFTVGHGGYFSPQQFLSFGIPIEWAQRNGRLSYQLKGSVGVQYFKEDAAPYFPNSPSRQTAAAAAASDALAFGETGATAVYPGQSRTGLGYNLGAAMEYQMHPQVFLGGHLSLNNARNYREFAGGLYVRYAFQPYNGLQAFPVSPLRSPYASN